MQNRPEQSDLASEAFKLHHQMTEKIWLAHISLASFLWDVDKQGRLTSDAAFDQGLHCLLTECSIKI